MCDKLKSGYSRNSFSRFGDDLCEEILQYLWFEEKIAYECVCKQWKNTIYNRQHVLHIVESKVNQYALVYENLLSYNNALIRENLLSCYDNNTTELKGSCAVQKLLNKCKHIYHIIMVDIYGITSYERELRPKTKPISNNQLLIIIADNCKNLLSFKCYRNTYYSNDNAINFSAFEWHYFEEKCGKTLQSITFPNLCDLEFTGLPQHLLTLCPNIIRLEDVKLSQLIDQKFVNVLVPKLREIRISYEPNPNDLTKRFANRYANTIKVIETNQFGSHSNQFIEHLSELVNLEIFKYEFSYYHNFLGDFQKFAINCKLIKRLTLQMWNFHNHYTKGENGLQLSTYTRLFKCINNCAKLEYLHLNVERTGADKNDIISVALLKNCIDLKYLSLSLKINYDEFFRNIGTCLPKLKHIKIKTSRIITDETMKHMSQLKVLNSININSGRPKITDFGVFNLIDNCSQLNSITLRYCDQITTATIDKMINIAIQRPKINFTVKLKNTNNRSHSELNDYAINLKPTIPSNIDIKFEYVYEYYYDSCDSYESSDSTDSSDSDQ